MDYLTEQKVAALKKRLAEIEHDEKRVYAAKVDVSQKLANLITPFAVGDVIDSLSDYAIYKGRFAVHHVPLYQMFSSEPHTVRLVLRKVLKDGSLGLNFYDVASTEHYTLVGHMEMPRMSRAYPNIVAQDKREVEQWYEKQFHRVKSLPAASIDSDTGVVECRMVPVKSKKPNNTTAWWPVSIKLRELAQVQAELSLYDLEYDESRKSQIGYQRGLMVSLS